MALKKTKFAPRFHSQLSSSSFSISSFKHDSMSCSPSSLAQTPAYCTSMTPAHMRGPGLMIPAALPKDGLRATGHKKRKATGPQCLSSPKKKTSTACHRDESQSTSSAPDSVREKDAFVFSKGDEQPESDKEKIKMAVLRNISRMLAGNNQIRQRLMSLSQVQCSHTQST